jgi:YegS/Rv2252/BmrU family lipid kinase
VWARAEPLLAGLGRGMTVHQTGGRGSATRIALDVAGEGPGSVLLAVGGDGTVHEVANGLLRSARGREAPALAILPAGSGNDLARQLGFSKHSGRLATRLQAGRTTLIDAGLLTWPGASEWFVNVASFGFTGAAARIADRMGKRFGGVSYVASALLALARHRDFDLRTVVDGGPPWSGQLCTGILANAAWFGSGMHVAPGARVDDGMLDLVTVTGAGRLRLAGLLAGVFGGWHLSSRSVSRRLVRSVRVEWAGDLPWEADGEVLAVESPVLAEVHPAVLRVVAAPQAAG